MSEIRESRVRAEDDSLAISDVSGGAPLADFTCILPRSIFFVAGHDTGRAGFAGIRWVPDVYVRPQEEDPWTHLESHSGKGVAWLHLIRSRILFVPEKSTVELLNKVRIAIAKISQNV